MPELSTGILSSTLGTHSFESYAALIGEEPVERILRKAARLRGLHIAHIRSPFYGGGLTEATWEDASVVGGNVGGIRQQITDSENDFPANSFEEAAKRIVQLLKNQKVRGEFGTRARETVRQSYLLSHLVVDWIDLLTESVQDPSKH